jgi:hypothetical protein
LSTLTPDHFAVRSSTGELLSNDIITAVSTGSCSQSYCPVYLTIDHFTDFDLRPILTYVHIQSNNTFSPLFAQDGDEVTLDFVSNEALTTSPLIFINGAEFVATDIQNKTHWQKVLRIGNDISLDDGQIFFALAYADELLNTGLTVTGTTDDSFVIVANSPEAPSTPTIETIGTITSGDSIDLVGVASPYTIISVFFDEKRELIIAT